MPDYIEDLPPAYLRCPRCHTVLTVDGEPDEWWYQYCHYTIPIKEKDVVLERNVALMEEECSGKQVVHHEQACEGAVGEVGKNLSYFCRYLTFPIFIEFDLL